MKGSCVLQDQWNFSQGGGNFGSNNPYGSSGGSQGNRKVIRALAYVPMLFWLPLVCYPNDRIERHYANQGLWLLILNVIVGLLRWIVMKVFGSIFLLGTLAGIGFSIIGFVLFLLMVFGIIKAVLNDYFQIPILGAITLL
ncbi:MAG: hypothetical protein ACOX60_10030 [Massiliimalia sp.]